MPELFGYVGSEGSQQDDQWLKHLTRASLQTLQFVDTDHEGSDGSIEGELLDVSADLLDELVEALEFLLRGRRVADTECTLLGVE